MTAGNESWQIVGAMLPWQAGTGPEQWSQHLHSLAGAGFTGVDLTDSWLNVGDLSTDQLARLASAVAGAGLDLQAISVIRRSVIDPDYGDRNLAYSHASIEAAAALGARVVSVGLHRPLTEHQRTQLWFWTVPGPADEMNDKTYAHAASRLGELADHAREVGVELSLEMYEDTLLGSASSALRLLDMIGRDNVGINPDIGNLVRQQRPIGDVNEMLREVLPWTNFWHVKNYLRMEDPATRTVFTAPSSMRAGVIDYRHAFDIARECGFSGAICIEQYGGDSLGMMRENLAYCKELLEGLKK